MEAGVEEPFEAPPTLGKNDKLDDIMSMLDGSSTANVTGG